MLTAYTQETELSLVIGGASGRVSLSAVLRPPVAWEAIGLLEAAGRLTEEPKAAIASARSILRGWLPLRLYSEVRHLSPSALFAVCLRLLSHGIPDAARAEHAGRTAEAKEKALQVGWGRLDAEYTAAYGSAGDVPWGLWLERMSHLDALRARYELSVAYAAGAAFTGKGFDGMRRRLGLEPEPRHGIPTISEEEQMKKLRAYKAQFTAYTQGEA